MLFLEVLGRLAAAGVLLSWVGACALRLARRRFPTAPPDAVLLAASVWAIATLVAPAMALGALDLLHPVFWVPLVALAAWGLGAWAARDANPVPAVADRDAPSPVFVCVLAGVLVGRALFVMRNPPADVDSLLYHLPMIAFWSQSGSLGAALSYPPAIGTYFPGNGELLQMFATWATGRDTITAWPGLLGLGLLGLALRRACLDAGARRPVAEALALGLALAPGAVRLTSGIRIDTLLAAWFVVALVFALRFRRSGAPRELEVALIASGLVVGAKSNGPAYAAFIALAAFASRDLRARLGALPRASAGLVVAAVLGGFWFTRNLIASGNPIYPAPLHLGPIQWDGLLRTETLKRTSQLFMWLHGQGGHFNPRNLFVFYGAAFYLTLLGAVIVLAVARERMGAGDWGAPSRTRTLGVLGMISLGCLCVFLAGPYSGASHPPGPGHPPLFSVDNMRYAMPAVAALLPVAAVGLSRFPGAPLATAIVAIATLVGLRPMYGHALPGILLLALAAAAWRGLAGFRRSHATATAAAALFLVCGGVAALVVRLEPLRERVTDQISDGYKDRFPNLAVERIRGIKDEAGGRPIACVGVLAWWSFFGRDLSGHPVYVPVATPWDRAARPYRFVSDPRDRADRALWLANLERSDAAFVVLVPPHGCAEPLVEESWCAADPNRFRLRAADGCRSVYEVVRK